jgi:hypothetical protein
MGYRVYDAASTKGRKVSVEAGRGEGERSASVKSRVGGCACRLPFSRV